MAAINGINACIANNVANAYTTEEINSALTPLIEARTSVSGGDRASERQRDGDGGKKAVHVLGFLSLSGVRAARSDRRTFQFLTQVASRSAGRLPFSANLL